MVSHVVGATLCGVPVCASTENGSPYAAPYLPIRPGQSSPISNDSTVPDTAPTANSTAATCDQRCATNVFSAGDIDPIIFLSRPPQTMSGGQMKNSIGAFK